MNLYECGLLGIGLIVLGGWIRTKTLVIDWENKKIKLIDTNNRK